MRYLFRGFTTYVGFLKKITCCVITPSFSGFQRCLFTQRYKFSTLQNNQYNSSADLKIQNYFDKLSINQDLIPEEIESYRKDVIKVLLNSRSDILQCIKDLEELKNDKGGDNDFKCIVNEEFQSYSIKLSEVENDLLEYLMPEDEASQFEEAVVEVSAGVGGQEAMLFAKSLFEMYVGYVDYKGWDYTLAEYDTTELGGLRFGSILVEGEDVFKYLQFETGVHRVQRIPITEKSGRVHTSTATVAVLPQPTEIQVNILEKDLKIDTKRASGAGGQHVNTTDSAVRMTHLPTGIVVECQTARSQIKNREIALKRLQANIFNKQMEEQNSQLRNMRKLQVGTSSRSDKIRTYNFNQDRITDHRLTNNFHHVEGFLEGNKYLDNLVLTLIEDYNIKRINLFLESIGIKN